MKGWRPARVGPMKKENTAYLVATLARIVFLRAYLTAVITAEAYSDNRRYRSFQGSAKLCFVPCKNKTREASGFCNHQPRAIWFVTDGLEQEESVQWTSNRLPSVHESLPPRHSRKVGPRWTRLPYESIDCLPLYITTG
jgi:hypothetical protein